MRDFIKKYPYILLVIGIILGVSIVLLVNFAFFNSNKKDEPVKEKETEEKEEDQNKPLEVVEGRLDSSSSSDENLDNSNSDDSTSDSVSNSKPSSQTNSEASVINHFNSLNAELDNKNDENNKTFRQRAKETFVNCVDFLFYDKEINGYKFSELTDKTKLTVIKIVLSIDKKIDSYFPNYKDDIKSGYQNVKAKVVAKYLEITADICEDNASTCESVREDFKKMRETFGITWDLVKDILKSGSGALKEWYEIYRES